MNEQVDYLAFYSAHVKGLRRISDTEYQGHCPFGERHSDGKDENPSFSVNIQSGLYHCFGCGARGNLKMFCRALGLPFPGKQQMTGREPEAVFDYRDESGDLLYQVLRFPGKVFRQRRPDGHGGWIWSTRGIKRVPYRLPELIKADPNEWVFLPEGEKHCNQLCALGLVATTNPMGAGKWGEDLVPWFRGRRVCILPDNDPPGQNHAQDVAKKLTGIAAEIRILNLPGLGPKGDILDWLNMGHTVDELRSLLESTPAWQPTHEQAEFKKGCQGPKQLSWTGIKESISTRLVKMAFSDPTLILFHDERKAAFVKHGKLIFAVRSKEFREYLRALLWQAEQRTCGRDAIDSAIGIIEAYACLHNPGYSLDVRVAKRKEHYYYDLGDGRVVRFSPDKWEILTETPIIFRSFPHQKRQINPVAAGCGNIKKVLDYVNFKNESDQLLYLCYLVSLLVPDIPHPIIILTGEQGSGKSTLFKVTKPLVDPSAVLTIGHPKKPDELVQTAYHHWVLYLDNLTCLPDWVSDALCRFCTGEGYSKRELYSDDSDIFYSFKRCIGLNGINLVADRPDLLDRSIIFSFERISDKRRKSETILYQQFEQELPSILGGMFDVFALGIKLYNETQPLDSLPRMADFALWGCAIARALGYHQEEFLTAYYENIKLQNEEAIDASPVGKAIIHYMEGKSEIKKPSSELLDDLEHVAAELGINPKSNPYWPKDQRWLWRRIKEVKPNLQAFGLDVVQERDKHHRMIHIHLQQYRKNVVTNDTVDTNQKNQMFIGDDIGADKKTMMTPDKNDVTYGDDIGDISADTKKMMSPDNTLKNKCGDISADSDIIFPTLSVGYKTNLREGEI